MLTMLVKAWADGHTGSNRWRHRGVIGPAEPASASL